MTEKGKSLLPTGERIKQSVIAKSPANGWAFRNDHGENKRESG
jgi:hypothetical protein